MTNLDFIIENYKKLHTEELILIAQKPADLEIEIIPHLQSELLNRNRKEEALLLTEYLVSRPKWDEKPTKDELVESIKARIDVGESLESISLDLKENGINLFEILGDQNKFQNKAFEYLTSLKEKGLDEIAIGEKMKETFGITEQETDVLKVQLKNKGRKNVIIGYIVLIIVGILGLISVALGGYISIGGMVLIGIAIWQIMEGNRQKR
jgi:hypothetical protein